MNTEFFGSIVDLHVLKNKVFIVCEKDLQYTLILHDKAFDVTDVLLQTLDKDLVDFVIKEKIKNL